MRRVLVAAVALVAEVGCGLCASDPQARKEYDLPASGSVVTQIELLDP